MARFRPRIAVPAAPPPGRARRAMWLAVALVAIAAIGLLVAMGDGSSEARDPVAGSVATRSVSGVPTARDNPLAALPPPDPYRPDPAGATLLRELKLEPRRTASGTGYVVTPADAELLAATPLREGDVLLEIDGQKLDPARVTRLADELGDYDDVWVSFERGGRKQEVLLELRRR